MPCGEHAQHIEKSDQRDIPGHDDQHAPGLGDRNRVGRQPLREYVAPEHHAGDGRYGAANVRRRKPAVFPARTPDYLPRAGVFAETAQAAPEPGKESDGIFHGAKIAFRSGICTFYPKLCYICMEGS